MTDPKPASVVAAEAEIAAATAKAEADAQAAEAAKAAAKAAKAAKDAEPKKPPRTPDQIRADIEATRLELGATVDALSAKLDVKSRAQSYVKDPANKPQLIAAGVALVSLLGLVILKKVRS